MKKNQRADQQPKEHKDGDGDDPRDTPRPKIYGEELDAHNCEPDFIITSTP